MDNVTPTDSVPSRPRIAVIIAAAGKSKRFDSATPKVWTELSGQTLVERAWRSFTHESFAEHQQTLLIEWIGIAVSRNHLEQVRRIVSSCPLPVQIVQGGDTRTQSVHRVLREVPDEIDIIAVHDAARPFWPVHLWDELVTHAATSGGAILAIPLHDTV